MSAHCTHTCYVHTNSLCFSLALSLSLHMRALTRIHITHNTAQSVQWCMYVSLAYSCLHLLQILNVVFCGFCCVALASLPLCVHISGVLCCRRVGLLWWLLLRRTELLLFKFLSTRQSVTGMLPLKWYVYLCARSKPASRIIGILFSYIFSQQGRATAVMFRSSEVWPSSICKNFIYYRNTTANQARM